MVGISLCSDSLMVPVSQAPLKTLCACTFESKLVCICLLCLEETSDSDVGARSWNF